jgi:hypothetical protein
MGLVHLTIHLRGNAVWRPNNVLVPIWSSYPMLPLPRTGIAQSVQRRATGSTTKVRFPARVRDSSLLHSIQSGSGAHPASYAMATGGSFPNVKRPRREADHSPPSTAGQEWWSNTSTPPYIFTAWQRDNFTFTLSSLYHHNLLFILRSFLYNGDFLSRLQKHMALRSRDRRANCHEFDLGLS